MLSDKTYPNNSKISEKQKSISYRNGSGNHDPMTLELEDAVYENKDWKEQVTW